MALNATSQLRAINLLDDKERQKLLIEQHQKEREALWANENFAIGMLQAVSGGAVFGMVSELSTLNHAAGQFAVRLVLTELVSALVLAIAAAYFRHEYIKWDVKAHAAASQDEYDKAAKHLKCSNDGLDAMRASMKWSAVALVGALAFLVVGLWGCWLMAYVGSAISCGD